MPGEQSVSTPDLIEREFTAGQPGNRLVGDVTYLRTDEGWLYLATVIDLATRMVVGWQTAANMRTSLIIDALTMAKRHGHIRRGSKIPNPGHPTTPDSRNRGEPAAGRPARPVRRVAWETNREQSRHRAPGRLNHGAPTIAGRSGPGCGTSAAGVRGGPSALASARSGMPERWWSFLRSPLRAVVGGLRPYELLTAAGRF
ncbi:hypothetical protein GCM10022225_83970 [Plantactinospora mayteni]|uniref:Integrase catalytic domain-containing protein n=1 Tax=Plantactinospora mayteni TaxID=566021 RepID=A0ABQ4F4K7_9ACTN|nr:hypothetical protein Pma05_84140 [Plantactinospora mayteni]